MDNRPKRQIRSFVLRQGRLTAGQRDALSNTWPTHGLEFNPEHVNWHEVFGNDNPVTLEIGFGNGDSLATMAEESPERNFLGIEVHGPGVGHLLHLVGQGGQQNIRVARHDAIDVLEQMVAPESLDRLQLFFPDPWHKTRHHKRRIVQSGFLDLVASRLKKGGVFHMATDWKPYAQHALKTLSEHPAFGNSESETSYSERPSHRPKTKFEARGQRLGHGVWDLIWVKL